MTKVSDLYIRSGLSVIPCGEDKKPQCQWTPYKDRLPKTDELSYPDAIGIVCGKVSGGLEVVDVDLKNDPTGTLIERLDTAKEIHGIDFPYVIQKTPSGGCHLIYKCPVVEGNQKLAQSPEGKTLIETRGEGGYILAAPSAGYEVLFGDLLEIPTITIDQRDALLAACRSLNEKYDEVRPPKQATAGDITPWEDFNQRADVPAILQKHGWTFTRTIGENQHFCRPDKTGATSGTWNGQRFYCFTSSTILEPSKAYTPSALFTYLECGKDFSEAGRRLRAEGYGSKPQIQSHAKQDSGEVKDFKQYIIRVEPTEELGIIKINSVTVLSIGNVLLITGPMKGRKTMLASILVNQSGLRTAYIDSEQGRKHSWRTGQFTPNADVFHLRGEDPKEIMRVINCCVECGEYQLMVLDNVRDLLRDFNNVEESGELELFLKKISESIPVIAILHENKNSQKGQGHLGHGAAKIAQTTVRVQLVDIEDPAKGSFVECVHTRDEPFRRAFISVDGVLSNDNLLKAGGKTMIQEDFFRALGSGDYSRDEMMERIGEIFGIMKTTARNAFTEIRKACPDAILERKEGKSKVYYVSPNFK